MGDHGTWGAAFRLAWLTGRQDTSEGAHEGYCTQEGYCTHEGYCAHEGYCTHVGLRAGTTARRGVLTPCIPPPPSPSGQHPKERGRAGTQPRAPG